MDKPETTPAKETVEQDENAEVVKPDYLTAEAFNKASTARERRLVEKVEKLLAEKLAPAAKEDDSDEPTLKEGTSPAEIAARKALAKARELERKSQERDAQLVKEKASLMAKEEKTTVMSTLQRLGATVPAAALAVLKDEGRVIRNDEGELMFRASRKVGNETFDEEISIEDGLTEWLNSSTGKLFQPPKGLEGSGANPRSKGTGSRPASKEERAAHAANVLMSWVKGSR